MLNNTEAIGPLEVAIEIERWPLKRPFKITGYEWADIEVLTVRLTLTELGISGWGESFGVYYRGETAESMRREIDRCRSSIESGVSRAALQAILPAGGARNAVDCALWDLESRVRGQPVWRLIGVAEPRELVTTFTCGADAPEVMAQTALAFEGAKALKLKLTGDGADADRILAVREARPDVTLRVDANQGLTVAKFERLLPSLSKARVALIEQPFPVGKEHWIDALQSPIPLAADESMQTSADLPLLVPRFAVVNIKLDKCGGLTEALAATRLARSYGLQTMVSNMPCTSLAMAPACVLAGLCDIVDLDGPTLLRRDRKPPVEFHGGRVSWPEGLWGPSDIDAMGRTDEVPAAPSR